MSTSTFRQLGRTRLPLAAWACQACTTTPKIPKVKYCHDPRRPRSWRHLVRQRRFLRYGPQRNAARPGPQRASRSRAALSKIRCLRANDVHPITDLQSEYSLISRNPEAKIFRLLNQLGTGITAYGILSRGLLSGSLPTGKGDFRPYLPRFSGDNLALNQHLITEPTQIAIAWVLAKGRNIVPPIGARTRMLDSESNAPH